MKQYEIDKIRQLDSQGTNGTIQACLMDPKINQAHYQEVLYYLLIKCLEEKSYLERVSNAMTNVLQTQGLHAELNRCLELKE